METNDRGLTRAAPSLNCPAGQQPCKNIIEVKFRHVKSGNVTNLNEHLLLMLSHGGKQDETINLRT